MTGGRGRAHGDGGAAVAEFVLVTVLLLFLFALVFQVGLVLHMRTLLVASAQEGARYAANADRSPAEGVQRTREEIGDALGQGVLARTTVTPGTTTVAGAPVVRMTVRGRLPLLFLPAAPLTLTVSGSALEEAP